MRFKPWLIASCVGLSFFHVSCQQLFSRKAGLSTFNLSSQTLLPVEVFVNDDAPKTISVDLTEQKADDAQAIYMQIHNLDYPDEAFIRINGEAWTPLNQTTLQVEAHGSAYGGIGGGFSTLRFTYPLGKAKLMPGANTFEFRLSNGHGRVSAFRVLRFMILDRNNQDLIPAGTFGKSDPNTWRPPLPDANSIAAGAKLWNEAPLKDHIGNSIRAKCSGCHTEDGHDLKYFSYSNETIVSRSRFHGLSELEGKQIASYIRSLPGGNPGRPWNPPFQPGPGMDSKPVSEWSAGAGLEWVLDNEVDMLKFIFPNGIKADAIPTNGVLNQREIPIAFQLPDWNHWLPDRHPLDTPWGDEFLASAAYRRYSRQGTFPTANPTIPEIFAKVKEDNYKSFRSLVFYPIAEWNTSMSQFLSPKTLDKNAPSTKEYWGDIYSTVLWQLVKTWEITEKYGTNDHYKDLYPHAVTSRGWPTSRLFNSAPHMLHSPKEVGIINDNPTETVFTYFTMAWWMVTLIVTNGNQSDGGDTASDRASNNPLDWSYLFGFAKELANISHLDQQPLLTLLSAKAMQVGGTGIVPGAPYGRGWILEGSAGINHFVHPAFLTYGYTSMSSKQRADLLNAVFETWLNRSSQFTPSQWYEYDYTSADEVPKQNGVSNSSAADKVWYLIGHMNAMGVNPDLISRATEWAKTVWPNANWTALTTTTCDPMYVRCSTDIPRN